jgi:hypothetical protein
MLAKDILAKSRFTLSDTAKDRWSDERLLSLLNDGILHIAKSTTLFVETVFYVVTDLVVDIDLSTTVLKFLRAEYLDEPLPFYSFDEMDSKYGKAWQLNEGPKVTALVYDKQKNGLLKQYPIVSNAQNTNIVYNSLYGIVTYISYSDIEPILEAYYGDVASIPDDALIKFYYIRKHAKVTDINTELDIDDLVAQPLEHYITGMALRDNQDIQNRTMATEELKLFDAMIEEYNIEKSQLFVRTVREARYRPND